MSGTIWSMLVVATALAGACDMAHGGANDSKPVRTSEGLLQGTSEGGVVVYKGVPFATPPLGELRWRAPQPAHPWDGILDASSYKPQCMQLGPPLPTMPEEPASEDCLYLNVWAPAAPTSVKRPVMVYLYGGGFRRGSASTPLYWGHQLAKKHGVIVVNIAYRVGPLGFLVHPELTRESQHRASGNYALLDMIAGLRWVQQNAAAFGGDAGNVTVFGQSAGGWAVNKLMISPLARGLFHAAIAQSGGDMGPTGTHEGLAVLKDAEKSGIAFATTLGAQSLAELRQLSAETITASTFDGLPDIPHSNASLPIVDGYVIPGDTYELYAAGKQADVPLLIGYNSDEGAYIFPRIDTATYVTNTRKTYGAFADRILSLYPASPEAESGKSQQRLAAESSFGWQAWKWARVHSQTSHHKVFFYFFSDRQGGHGAELPFVFHYEFGGPWTDRERKIANIMSSYWTNFAKSGDPNGAGLPHWPVFDTNKQLAMHLGESSTAKLIPDLSEHLVMDAYMNSLR